MSQADIDWYARVYDAVSDALEYESLESVEDAVNQAIEAWESENE
jgi:hypothetical protein